MKTLLAVSLGLNALLLTTLGYVVFRPAPPAQQPSAPVPRSTPASTPRPPRTAIVTVNANEPFHWGSLESSDFRQYMENLRAVGCPEETVRDLIVAEVNNLFAPRFAALAARTQTFDYWRMTSTGRTNTVLSQLRALQDERKALLRELLGIDDDPYSKWAHVDLNRLRQEGKYSFIPAEKQAQVRAIMEKYDQQIEAARAGRGNEPLGDGNTARRLREQRQQELAQILSPDELKELALRDSNTADSLRNRFGGMDLTESEYRTLFDLRKAYEDTQGAIADFSDPEKMRQRSEARRQLEDAYRTALGEQRWEELQKQQDPTWRGLTQLAQQNNLSPTTVDQAWQFQRQIGEQINHLLQDRSLADANRDAAIQQLMTEYEQNLKSLLGDQAYQQFKQTTPQFTYSSSGGDSFTFFAPISGGARQVELRKN